MQFSHFGHVNFEGLHKLSYPSGKMVFGRCNNNINIGKKNLYTCARVRCTYENLVPRFEYFSASNEGNTPSIFSVGNPKHIVSSDEAQGMR